MTVCKPKPRIILNAYRCQPFFPLPNLQPRFADWTEEEYYALMMPDAWRRKQGLPSLKQTRRKEVWMAWESLQLGGGGYLRFCHPRATI